MDKDPTKYANPVYTNFMARHEAEAGLHNGETFDDNCLRYKGPRRAKLNPTANRAGGLTLPPLDKR